MPTYLYCLLTSRADIESAPVTARGIGGSPVRALSTGALEAWVSTVSSPSPAAALEAIREHDAVVSAALATGRTPLPARFGQTWPSDAGCVAAIAERAADFESALRRISGLVEMTVCTLPSTPVGPRPRHALPHLARAADPDGAPGRAYLEQLRARADHERHLRAALERLRARVSGALGGIARGEVAEIRGRNEALSLAVSYLVERGSEGDFRRAVQEVSREATARLVIAGPRAPYSFAPRERPTAGT
jgi:hypothetical protein